MIDAVTRRYGEALFALAKRTGSLDAVKADVAKLGGELAAPAVARYLFDARIPLEHRRDKLAPVLDGMHQHTKNLVNLLFDKRREQVLAGIAQAIHALDLADRGEAEGVVESARPLPAEELERLAKLFGARLDEKVHLENEVVPDLVGGVRVTVGSRMIDYSVRGRLEGLRRSMLEAPLPAGNA